MPSFLQTLLGLFLISRSDFPLPIINMLFSATIRHPCIRESLLSQFLDLLHSLTSDEASGAGTDTSISTHPRTSVNRILGLMLIYFKTHHHEGLHKFSVTLWKPLFDLTGATFFTSSPSAMNALVGVLDYATHQLKTPEVLVAANVEFPGIKPAAISSLVSLLRKSSGEQLFRLVHRIKMNPANSELLCSSLSREVSTTIQTVETNLRTALERKVPYSSSILDHQLVKLLRALLSVGSLEFISSEIDSIGALLCESLDFFRQAHAPEKVQDLSSSSCSSSSSSSSSLSSSSSTSTSSTSALVPNGGIPPPLSLEDDEDTTFDASVTYLPLIQFFFLTHKQEQSRDDAVVEEGAAAAPPSSSLQSFIFKYRDILNSLLRLQPALLSTTLAPLLQHPHLIDLPNKRVYFQKLLRQLRHVQPSSGSFEFRVRRENILEDSFNEFASRNAKQLRPRLRVTFQGEEGVDAGGVTRAWLQELAQKIFDPNYALFHTFDSVSYQPTNFRSLMDLQNENTGDFFADNHLRYLHFVGRLVGKVLYDGHTIDLHFTQSFYKHMLGKPISYLDIEGVDPEYFQSLKAILENPGADSLYLTFSATVQEFGHTSDVDLIPGGQSTDVTDDNKHEYVRLMAEFKLIHNIRQQIDSFLEGFNEIIPPETIAMFNERELELIIAGLPRIDVEDWFRNTELQGYRSSDQIIQWFWEIVRNELDSEELALLLQFCTGSAKVPVCGFAGLMGNTEPRRFSIKKISAIDRLPVAHTCFNQLDLPEYRSKADLKSRLLTAIKETNSFGIA